MRNMVLNNWIVNAITSLVILTVASVKAQEAFQPDIVPWPKQIKLESAAWELDAGKEAKIFLLIGKNPSPQVKAGVALLKNKMEQLGVTMVVQDGTDAPFEMPSGIVIRVGVAGQDSWLAKPMADLGIAVTDKDPGEQGYVISSHSGKGQRQILLVGSDPAGALYACVTLKSLISKQDGRISIWPAQIRDFPDLKQRWLGTPQWHGTGS